MINGGAGGDTLTVDSPTAAFTIPITYNGQGGGDLLKLVGSAAAPATSDIYTPGPLPGAGLSTLTFASGTESVAFLNLMPVIDTVTVPLGGAFIINGTPGNDAISYTQGGVYTVAPLTYYGQVAVNNLEPVQFANKAALEIDTGTGSDTVTLADPTTPVALTGITVKGGSAGGTTLVDTGVSGVADNFVVTPQSQGKGTIADSTTTAVPVSYVSVAALQIVGQSAEADVLDVEGTAGSDIFIFTPGVTGDTGTITGTMDENVVPQATFALPTIGFSGISAPSSGKVEFQAGAAGYLGIDTLVYNGTPGNDAIVISGTGTLTIQDSVDGVPQAGPPAAGTLFNTVAATDLTKLVINPGAGTNLVTVAAGTGALAPPAPAASRSRARAPRPTIRSPTTRPSAAARTRLSISTRTPSGLPVRSSSPIATWATSASTPARAACSSRAPAAPRPCSTRPPPSMEARSPPVPPAPRSK